MWIVHRSKKNEWILPGEMTDRIRQTQLFLSTGCSCCLLIIIKINIFYSEEHHSSVSVLIVSMCLLPGPGKLAYSTPDCNDQLKNMSLLSNKILSWEFAWNNWAKVVFLLRLLGCEDAPLQQPEPLLSGECAWEWSIKGM